MFMRWMENRRLLSGSLRKEAVTLSPSAHSFLSHFFPFFFSSSLETGPLSGTWGSLIKLGWLAHEPRGSSCLYRSLLSLQACVTMKWGPGAWEISTLLFSCFPEPFLPSLSPISSLVNNLLVLQTLFCLCPCFLYLWYPFISLVNWKLTPGDRYSDAGFVGK